MYRGKDSVGCLRRVSCAMVLGAQFGTAALATDDSPDEALALAGPGEITSSDCPRAGHFLCYRARAKLRLGVSLADDFDSGTYDGKRSHLFCTPADKGGEGVEDPATHLQAFRIRGPHQKRSDVEMRNQFGTFLLRTEKTDSLMVPSVKSLSGDPEPTPDPGTPLDHFRCIKAKLKEDVVTVATVNIVDQFGERVVQLKKVRKLCAATNKTGEGLCDATGRLLCFKIKATPTTIVSGIRVANQLGSTVLNLKREKELCVPQLPTSTATTTSPPS